MPDIPLSDVQLSLFQNSFNSMPIGTITFAQIIHRIHAGYYRSKVESLRQILSPKGKPSYDKAKAYLPAVTFGGIFQPKRCNAYLLRHSGLLLLDLDRLADVAATKEGLIADPHIVFVFSSPGTTGLKAAVYGPTVTDDRAYKHFWNAARAEYEQKYKASWDLSGKDVARLCFVSYDPDCYVNFNAEIFEAPPAPLPDPRPQLQPLRVSRPATGYSDYAQKAIQTAVDMIQSAPLGVRHHTRLRAARLLGGYVAGGLLTEDQAYGALAFALVGHTDDLERALKTVEGGLAYGQGHPITIEALEAERQSWLTQHRSRQTYRDRSPSSDPWDGMNTLPLKPYQGYRGMTIRRAQTHG